MNNQDFTKCFTCSNRNPSGFCNITYCNYTPIKSQTTNEIKQEYLSVPFPISNKLEVNKNGD